MIELFTLVRVFSLVEMKIDGALFAHSLLSACAH